MTHVGIGLRPELAEWISSEPPAVRCLEIMAEHFFHGRHQDLLRDLHGRFPICLHSVSMSAGTPGPPDGDVLKRIREVVDQCGPVYVSEHVAFTRSGDIDLGHLNPVPRTREYLEILADNFSELARVCDRPVLVENITSHIRVSGDYSEPEFLNRLCEKAGCGLLLDVTNVLVNARNHGFDPHEWFAELNMDFVRQMHIVGYTMHGDRLYDSHAADIQPEILDLCEFVLRRARPDFIILERDRDYPAIEKLEEDLSKLQGLIPRTLRKAVS